MASETPRSRVQTDNLRKKPSPSIMMLVWVSLLGLSLLLLNTQMPRQTFRNLIQYQYIFEDTAYFNLSQLDPNATIADKDGRNNKTSGPILSGNKSAHLTENENAHDTTGNISIAGDVQQHSPQSEYNTTKDHDIGQKNSTNNFPSISDGSSTSAVNNSSKGAAYESSGGDDGHNSTFHSSHKDSNTPVLGHDTTNHSGTSSDQGKITTESNSSNFRENLAARFPEAVTIDDGNLQIEYFDRDSPRQRNEGIAACLINLEDTIRMAEWFPYHYATLPLGSLVIALDPNNSERGISRTLELIDLWKDKIEITLWPGFELSREKRFRTKQKYVRERQVYFANRCLAYQREQNRTWTLLTDNDEYVIFNYVHDDESLEYNHPGAKRDSIKKEIKRNRKTYMPLRKDLPLQNHSTVLDYIRRHDEDMRNTKNTGNNSSSGIKTKHFLPRCVRLPGIKYGGNRGANDTMGGNPSLSTDHQVVIEPHYLTTRRDIHHEGRKSSFSKVMIDVGRVDASELAWTGKNQGKTIHNPNKICGFNGVYDSGADYPSSLFRLNHYLGSIESYLERSGDYRKRSLDTYQEKARKVKPSESNWDRDIAPWMDVFVRSVGGATEAKKLLRPLVSYQEMARSSEVN